MERLAGRIILLWGWRRVLVAFTAGALAALTQAPWDFFAAGFVAFPLLVWLLDGVAVEGRSTLWRRMAPAFAVGWWFGFGYFLAGLWWIGNAMLVEADQFAWALPLAVIGIPLLLAFYHGFGVALARLMWPAGLGRIVSLAFGLGLAEWLRGVLLTGFPWNPIGLAAMPVPLAMQSSGVVGVVGVTVFAVFVFAMPAMLAGPGRRLLGGAAAALLVAAHLGYGWWRLGQPEAEGSALAVRIVQPDVDLSEKWDASVRDRIFATTMALSADAPEAGRPAPQLILWPETSVPFLFSDRPEALAALGEMLAPGQMLLAGAVRAEPGAAEGEPLYYNSVLAIGEDGTIVDAVDKVHLVPFGEYLPFAGLLARLGIHQLVAGPMTFEAGAARHALALPGGALAAPFICYEIIFPDMVAADAANAGFIVNVTNDAWFGDSPGPYQHLRQAQVRAAETGIPVLRAANTGISAVIDSRGRIVDALAMDVAGRIDAEVKAASPSAASYPSSGLRGIVVLILFGVLAGAAALSQRVRSN